MTSYLFTNTETSSTFASSGDFERSLKDAIASIHKVHHIQVSFEVGAEIRVTLSEPFTSEDDIRGIQLFEA